MHRWFYEWVNVPCSIGALGNVEVCVFAETAETHDFWCWRSATLSKVQAGENNIADCRRARGKHAANGVGRVGWISRSTGVSRAGIQADMQANYDDAHRRFDSKATEGNEGWVGVDDFSHSHDRYMDQYRQWSRHHLDCQLSDAVLGDADADSGEHTDGRASRTELNWTELNITMHLARVSRNKYSFFDGLPRKSTCCAYGHVRSLVSDANAGTRIEEGDGDASDEPLPKRAKQDVRAATLGFISRRGDTAQAMPTAEFDQYLGSAAAPECDLLTWWREHADVDPHWVCNYCWCQSLREMHIIAFTGFSFHCLFSRLVTFILSGVILSYYYIYIHLPSYYSLWAVFASCWNISVTAMPVRVTCNCKRAVLRVLVTGVSSLHWRSMSRWSKLSWWLHLLPAEFRWIWMLPLYWCKCNVWPVAHRKWCVWLVLLLTSLLYFLQKWNTDTTFIRLWYYLESNCSL